MASAGIRALLLALTAIAVMLLVDLAAYRVPAPRGVDAPPGLFSAARARAILRDLPGSGVAHPIGSAAEAPLREALVRRLSELGYSVELQSGFICNAGVCGKPVNIIARRGQVLGNTAVLLAAHYDSVPAGPGAADDGAGVASVLEIARILASAPPPPHPVVVLLTDGEEAGLLGARLFVQAHPLAKHFSAAVNLESRGTSGPSLMFETGTANAWLMRLYGSAIARPVTNSLYYIVYQLLPNDTDFSVFKRAAYQGFNFAFIGNVARYHTPLDSVAHLDGGSIQQQGDNALAALTALANSSNSRPPAGEAVFFDAFARTLFTWPSAAAVPAALLILVLLTAEILLFARAKRVTGREILWGGAGMLFTLSVGALLGVGLLAVGMAAGKVPPLGAASWIAHPLPMHLAAAALAPLAAGIAGIWLARRAGFWGCWAAASLLTAACGALSALEAPGASFVFLLPTLAAVVAALPAAVRAAQRGAPSGPPRYFAAVFPVLVFFCTVFPLLRYLYAALGSLAWPVSTLVLCLVAAMALPLFAAVDRRVCRRIIVAAALIAAGGGLLALALPTYSAEWPERINLEYWTDTDTGESHYLARCDSRKLPADLAAAARFDAQPRPRFQGSWAVGFHAAALRLPLAPPQLELMAPARGPQSPSGNGTAHFAIHLASARGAPEMVVLFPASAHVAEVTLATAAGPVRAELGKLKDGGTVLDIVSMPAAGIDLGFDSAGPRPLTVQVFDQSYDFPDAAGLSRARPSNAVSSQDGDVTVVHRTVSLDPAADR